MSTYSAKPKDVQPSWYVVDAKDKNLGRLSSFVAQRLRGKHNPLFSPHVDTGDYIIIINAEKIHVTGKKATDKMYHSYTGYQGGLKTISFEKLLIKAPERIIQFAIKGMLPKGPLGRKIYSKLHVYAGTEHPHISQQPKVLEIEE
ncbi:MAG: 50S ribosomal protein L13 [Gammaproteobacteria bacterium GWE2_37_16]|nr:MAG: 50S ribosomal protein L13 [Gammaproteobacteria bacterium GWE2_37_16]